MDWTRRGLRSADPMWARDDGAREDRIARLAEMLAGARRIAVLTGAGLSAASGLQTYRGSDGRWKTEEPVQLRQFLDDPERRLHQWRRSLDDARAFQAARPNAGHYAVARLSSERDGLILTQNIDGLHARAGARAGRCLELHGEGLHSVCTRCGARAPILAAAAAVAAGESPACPADGALLRPNVVLFGAPLDPHVFAAAERAAAECDLFIALGTSLSVHPVAGLPALARRKGAKVVVMVDAPTGFDGKAHLVVRGDAVDAVSRAVAAALGGEATA